MKVVEFASERYGGVGYLEEGRVLDFSRAVAVYGRLYGPIAGAMGNPYFSISAMLRAQGQWGHGWFSLSGFRVVREFIAKHSLEEELTVPDAELLPPLGQPPRIFALGLNYAAHAAEAGRKRPKEPIVFVKASTAVVGPEESVCCYQGVGRIDHEVELAVIIGRAGRRIPRSRAAEHIAGYTILNDVTARDIQKRDQEASNPWFRSKSFDTFAPMGPCITLPDEIQEPCELDISLRVNGETRQSSNTRDLIFKVPDLIHWLSRYITLEPGDVISTGTPSGISAIKPGDVMEAEIERIGVLRNPVVAAR